MKSRTRYLASIVLWLHVDAARNNKRKAENTKNNAEGKPRNANHN
jgi:hypothetical protein